MTSVLRRYAHIDPRVAFFQPLDSVAGWTLDPSSNSTQMMTVDAFNAAFNEQPSQFSVGFLLKDLGRQITVYDPTTPGSAHVAVFRQVMQVSGPAGYEGLSSNIAYICTWEDGSGSYPYQLAPVARTG